ncbi:MAG: response regulator [Anaerolineaceae bacterium]
MNPNKSKLLIENNLDDIDLAIKAFQPFKNIRHIQTAKESEEALSSIASWKDNRCLPSLILLDLNLPKIDGFELLRVLKSNSRSAKTPVIILTTSTEESDIRQAYQLWPNSYLKKSIILSEFQEIASLI